MKLNEQQEAAAHYSGDATNILVNAGAGCGKTRVIVARVIHLVKSGTDASRLLLMTFTNKAAKEMKSRLKKELGPIADNIQAGTFHAFCLRVMTQLPKSFGIKGLTVIDADDQKSLMTIARSRHVKQLDKQSALEYPSAKELIVYYSYSRNTCQTPQQYLQNNTDFTCDDIEQYCRTMMEYQKLKKQRGYLDFDDLLGLYNNALASKKNLRADIAKLYDEVLVDEMQDTNPLQFAILKHFSGEGTRLFCVGDPAQSIYKFRGAEFKHIHRFTTKFPNSVVLPLTENYRSNQEILDVANWLLTRSPYEYGNDLIAYRGKADRLPEVHDFENKFEEAEWVADTILERHEKEIPFRDMMVLVRSGFDAREFEAEFLKRDIPYHYIGGQKITEAAHVRDVLSLLRIVRNPMDELAWVRFLKLWKGIGDKTAAKVFSALLSEQGTDPRLVLEKSLKSAHPAVVAFSKTAEVGSKVNLCVSTAVSALQSVLEGRYDKWDKRQKDLDLLIKVSERYSSLSDLIDDFTLEPMSTKSVESLEVDDAVTLITVHSAKGTEAKICFVVNAAVGVYPHMKSLGDLESEEEERRVLYVAMTRAKDELYISRSTGFRGSNYALYSESEGEDYFLEDVPDDLVETELHGWESPLTQGFLRLKDDY